MLRLFQLLFILITLHIKYTLGTWYYQEAKPCDPLGSGFVPFTGFKIYREFKFLKLNPIPVHYLLLTHCSHGKVDYQAILKTPKASVNWDQPFCLLKPRLGKLLPLLPADTVADLVGEDGEDDMREHTQIFNKTEESWWRNSIRNFIKIKVEDKLEKLTKGKFIQYTSQRSKQHREDIQKSSPQKVLEWEARDLVCYKLARRKKYAKRDLTYYMPDTFVGGLFECPISSEKKKEMFVKMTANEILQPLNNFRCDEFTARPIMPLIADDGTKQWIQSIIGALNPSFIQTIPYLSTATPLNLRFSSTDTPDMHSQTWASRINVNEEYNYSDPDIHYISKAVALTADYLNKLIIFDLSSLPVKYGASRSHKLENPETTTILLNQIQNFNNMEHKFITWMALMPSSLVKKTLLKLQEVWDNLNIQ